MQPLMHSATAQCFWQTPYRSGCRCFLAPQPDRFLDRPVGEAEEHRIFSRRVRDAVPRGYDEDVARAPLEDVVADLRAAVSFDDTVHGAVGRAIARAVETGRQELEKRGYGRHRIAAARGVRVLELQPMARVHRAGAPKPLQ